jgi:NAD(P)-dependent dehydrogenase (short-subunit alcohol dehydrogenase family)
MVSNQTKGQSKMPELVAVVTGASQGIGRATALRIAKDFSGVVLAARNGEALKEVAAEVKSSGAEPLAFGLDLSMRESAETLIKGTLDRFGRIDALLNIAGVIAPIVGARTIEHLRNNLGAAELTLDDEATAVLEKVSAPQSGGYPYAAFGAGQRVRWLQDGTPASTPTYTAGSDHPTGRA